MEPHTKKRHDFNTSEDNEKLLEMLRKAKKTKKADKSEEKSKQKEKRKGHSRGVVPSVQKKQKSETKKPTEKIKEAESSAQSKSKSYDEDVATTRVRGVKIELDCMTLASILKIPGNYGLSDYVNEVWEEARYYKPLEITKKFSNDETITKAGRVSSSLMKPFQRMVHIFIMKNLIPRFRKRDTASFMDLTYMEY
ncbi:hypothetical protein Dimus_030797 [Dionaea muscipula]